MFLYRLRDQCVCLLCLRNQMVITEYKPLIWSVSMSSCSHPGESLFTFTLFIDIALSPGLAPVTVWRTRPGVCRLFCETATLSCLLAIRPMSADCTPLPGKTVLQQIDKSRCLKQWLEGAGMDKNKQDGGLILEEYGIDCGRFELLCCEILTFVLRHFCRHYAQSNAYVRRRLTFYSPWMRYLFYVSVGLLGLLVWLFSCACAHYQQFR